MFKKILTTIMLVIAVCLVNPASAAIGKIIAQSEAAEAKKIEVTVNKSDRTGVARVRGCKQCPLRLDINANTEFYHNGKPVPFFKIKFLFGKPGTVVYDADSETAIRIRW